MTNKFEINQLNNRQIPDWDKYCRQVAGRTCGYYIEYYLIRSISILYILEGHGENIWQRYALNNLDSIHHSDVDIHIKICLLNNMHNILQTVFKHVKGSFALNSPND